MVFCSVGETARSPFDSPQPKQLPNIMVYPYLGRMIKLRSGAKAQKDCDAAFKAELAWRVPAMKRPTF